MTTESCPTVFPAGQWRWHTTDNSRLQAVGSIMETWVSTADRLGIEDQPEEQLSSESPTHREICIKAQLQSPTAPTRFPVHDCIAHSNRLLPESTAKPSSEQYLHTRQYCMTD